MNNEKLKKMLHAAEKYGADTAGYSLDALRTILSRVLCDHFADGICTVLFGCMQHLF